MASENEMYIALIEKVSVKFENALIERLVRDGRVATKKLVNSVSHVVKEIFFGVQSEIMYNKYGNNFETGVPPARIPFSGTRKGGSSRTSKYIQGLVNWVKIKGLAGGVNKNPLSMAFAIAHKHKKFGMPLDRNINVLSDTIKEFTPVMEKDITEGIEDIIFVQLDNLVRDITQNFKFFEEL